MNFWGFAGHKRYCARRFVRHDFCARTAFIETETDMLPGLLDRERKTKLAYLANATRTSKLDADAGEGDTDTDYEEDDDGDDGGFV